MSFFTWLFCWFQTKVDEDNSFMFSIFDDEEVVLQNEDGEEVEEDDEAEEVTG